jgi:hypothetical protein
MNWDGPASQRPGAGLGYGEATAEGDTDGKTTWDFRWFREKSPAGLTL